ncbi:hypothetical protein ID866_10123 [Astraeus odoratus]|nr:hypothetical protein ID866_10123 [Astraeus odoratus]
MSYFVENIAEITVPLKSNAQNDPDPHSVPPEFKKEGADWVAVFNPKVRRVLDVSLMHTLMHESVVCCVRFSADGKYLATGCNRTAQIYDTTTGLKTCVLADESAGKVGDLYIRSVCFSPDGKYLATGAEDKQIRIWDIGKKRIRHIFDGHKQEIYSLDFSLDGRLLVSGSGDRTARIWDIVENTSKVLTINDPDALNNDAYVSSVVISPNGQLVAVGYLDTFVRIWDISTGHLVERLGGHRDSVYSVAFTPDGKGLVSGSLDKTLKYWDVSGLLAGGTKHKDSSANGRKDLQKPSQCTMNFVGHTDFVLSVAVSPDGQWIVSGSKDRGVQFWDAHSAMMQCMLQGHKNSVISVDLSPVGNMLATGSGDRQARICALFIKSEIYKIHAFFLSGSYQTTTSALDSIAPVSTAPNNGQLPDDPDLSVPLELEKEGADWVAVFNPKVKRVLDVSLVYTLMHESIVRCVRFSTDGKYLATGCNRTAQIYDTKTGLKTCVLADESADKARDLYIRSICFSPDGKYLATGADDNLIRIWDIAKERMRTTFDGHHQEVYSMDFSIDGRLIASGSGDATVRIWDMVENTCKVLAIDDPDALKNDPGVASVAISPNGQLVAAGYLDTFVRIWDISTGHLIERLRGHQDSVYSVTFTPDGKGLVSGSLDKTLKYWDVSGLLSGRENRRNSPENEKKDLQKPSHCTMNFVGHTDYVLSVAVSPDGQWVVSGSKDRGVQFWDAHSAMMQCMLQGHKNSVLSVDLSPAGNMLATGSGDWQARICVLFINSEI